MTPTGTTAGGDAGGNADSGPDDAGALAWAREEIEINRILGLFDTPSFARRGADLEYALARLDERLDRERQRLLQPVADRLRQWRRLAPRDLPPDRLEWLQALARETLLAQALAEPLPENPAKTKTKTKTGWFAARRAERAWRELGRAVQNFNRAWTWFLDSLDIRRFNDMIRDYNRFYILEKECVMGSPRLAARLFRPLQPLQPAELAERRPTLPLQPAP